MDCYLKKKSQISLYTIIAAIIIILFLILLKMTNEVQINIESQKIESFNHLTSSVKMFTEDCYEGSDLSLVYLDPIKNTDYPLEQNIAEDLYQQVRKCLSGIRIFEDRGSKIKTGKITYEIIQLDPLIIKYSYPITISDKINSFKLNEYTLRLPISITKLKKFIELAIKSRIREGYLSLDLKTETEDYIIGKEYIQTVYTFKGIENIVIYEFYDKQFGGKIDVPIVNSITEIQ